MVCRQWRKSMLALTLLIGTTSGACGKGPGTPHPHGGASPRPVVNPALLPHSGKGDQARVAGSLVKQDASLSPLAIERQKLLAERAQFNALRVEVASKLASIRAEQSSGNVDHASLVLEMTKLKAMRKEIERHQMQLHQQEKSLGQSQANGNPIVDVPPRLKPVGAAAKPGAAHDHLTFDSHP